MAKQNSRQNDTAREGNPGTYILRVRGNFGPPPARRWTTTDEGPPERSLRVDRSIGKTILHMLIRTLHKTAFLYIILHNLHIYNRFTFLHSNNNCFVVFIIIYSIYSPIAKYCRIFKHVFIIFITDTAWSLVSEYFFIKYF